MRRWVVVLESNVSFMFQVKLADQELLDEIHTVQEEVGFGNPQL